MKNSNSVLKWILQVLSYVLVAVLAASLTYAVNTPVSTSGSRTPAYISTNKGDSSADTQTTTYSKLTELQALIDEYFVNDADAAELEDGAAAGMISALGDRWSYYIPADEYEDHVEQVNNEYVGIGVTISAESEDGFKVLQVEPNGGAREAGILPGDVITQVNGQNVVELGLSETKNLIRGAEGSVISVTLLRDGQELTYQVTRDVIKTTVAKGQMLDGNIGLVTINNFDERCADETIAAIKDLVDRGAKALIFDVRFNPGGYKVELVEVLDYLLPEGVLFRSEAYTGEVTVDNSDASCLELPMAVLVNGSSYSAAEFFAAALSEYDWAVIVGEPTVGKSYYQNTFQLSDGSAVGLSVGKYYTPNGVCLQDEGGLTPDVTVEVEEDVAANIYAGILEPEEDPQIQAAVKALTQGTN